MSDIEQMLFLRGIDSPCEQCGGTGTRAYADSTTWRHGIGGQTMTSDVCESCWGSGDKFKHWIDLRKNKATIDRLKAENERLIRLITLPESLKTNVSHSFCFKCGKELEAINAPPKEKQNPALKKRTDDALNLLKSADV